MTSARDQTTPSSPILVLLAVVALAAAVVSAVGPDREKRALYIWPPTLLPAGTPSAGWYAPLPLLNRVPASLEVHLPCDLSPPLRQGASTVFATARDPIGENALRIVHARNALGLSVGRTRVASVPWPRSCPLRVLVRAGEVRMRGRAVPLGLDTPGHMPVVTAFFTGLNLQKGHRPTVALETRPYRTSSSARQLATGSVAFALVCVIFVLLARGERRPRRPTLRTLGLADAAVAAVLLVWWVIAPPFSDDGWLWVEHRIFSRLGTIVFYYDNWSLDSPVGYWIEWLRHWAIGSTSELVFMRIPSVLVLLAAWALCRWSFRAAVPGQAPRVAKWTLASTFLVGSTAWGLTIRLEPFMCLLAAIALAAMISFAHAPRALPLAIAASAPAFASTAHPTGIIAAAPLLAGAPEIASWLRNDTARLMRLATISIAAAALALLLLVIGSDLSSRLDEFRLVHEGKLHGVPWWKEYIRYTHFDGNGGRTPLRHLSLAVLFLPVAGWLSRRRSCSTGVGLLPARSVAVGLALLAFVPSKWPWHFGSLIALGAVAVAAEVARLVREPLVGRWRFLRPIGCFALVLAAAVWAWRGTGHWGVLDLQAQTWHRGFRGAWGVLLLVGAALLGVVQIRRGRWRIGRDIPGLAACVLVAVSFVLLAVTAAVLVKDAASVPWSPTRQNLGALVGRAGCGLAGQLRGRLNVRSLVEEPTTPTLVTPAIATYLPCAHIPRVSGGLVELPRLVVYERAPWPLTTPDGPFAAVSDLYPIRSVATGYGFIGVAAVEPRIAGYRRLDVIRRA